LLLINFGKREQIVDRYTICMEKQVSNYFSVEGRSSKAGGSIMINPLQSEDKEGFNSQYQNVKSTSSPTNADNMSYNSNSSSCFSSRSSSLAGACSNTSAGTAGDDTSTGIEAGMISSRSSSQEHTSIARGNNEDLTSNGNSLPSPDGLERTGTKNNKTMQTIAGVAGNVLEWYDFAVFGYFSDVIGNVFFPQQEGHAATIEAFAVFGLAFLCRPIGGVMLGYIGDIYGRKRALEISIFLMAFPTFAMGCLPSYAQVGNLAIVLLTFVRCLQGLSVGGQLVSSLVFTLESRPRSQWGLYGSYVMAAANFGTLLGGIISSLLRAYLNENQLLRWGWRLPFLSGILVSLCGLYLKYYCDEEAIENHHGGGSSSNNSDEKANPLRAALAYKNLRTLFAASLVPMLWSAGFYITFVWMATFMTEFVDPPVPGAFGVNAIALFLSVCLLFPLAGILSDMFGRTKIMYIGGTSMTLLSPVMIIIISSGNPVACFFAQSAMGISLSLWGAPMCAWLVESFPASMRLTSVAIGYNIAQALIGGTAPAIATWLADNKGHHAPGFMVSVIALLSLMGLCIAPPNNESEVENSAPTEPESFISYSDDEDDGDISCDKTGMAELI